jgi:hypothetical protein
MEHTHLLLWLQVRFKKAVMHVYANNDLVSKSITSSSNWEVTEVGHVLWALQQQQQQQAPLFVDIGANVGVFTVNAAAAGARVAAFEGEGYILHRATLKACCMTRDRPPQIACCCDVTRIM